MVPRTMLPQVRVSASLQSALYPGPPADGAPIWLESSVTPLPYVMTFVAMCTMEPAGHEMPGGAVDRITPLETLRCSMYILPSPDMPLTHTVSNWSRATPGADAEGSLLPHSKSAGMIHSYSLQAWLTYFWMSDGSLMKSGNQPVLSSRPASVVIGSRPPTTTDELRTGRS